MRLKKITALFLTGALILSMAGCAGNGSKDKKEGSAGNEAQEPVKIATKPMTEQFILGEMLKKLIEEKAGYEVELTKGIGGGTSNIQPAMEKGEFDLTICRPGYKGGFIEMRVAVLNCDSTRSMITLPVWMDARGAKAPSLAQIVYFGDVQNLWIRAARKKPGRRWRKWNAGMVPVLK